MFPVLLLGVALAIAALLLAPLVTRHGAQKVGNIVVVVLAVVAGVVALFALFTGRGSLTIAALIVLAVALIATLAGNAGGRRPRWQVGGGGAQRTSNVETAWLRMALNHTTGDIAGEVLQGRFAGRRLEDMSVEEVLSLLRECQSEDPQSAQLLEAWLDRAAPGWRGGSGEGAAPGQGPMTAAEALDLLGLPDDATDDDIREAHRRMMQKHHPDRGGTAEMAAKLNQARDVLLGVD